jgi:hypothetical protein
MYFYAGKRYNDSRDVIIFSYKYKNILVKYHYNDSEIYGVNRYMIEGIVERFTSQVQ